MPPKSEKKTPPGPGSKRGVRGTKAIPKAQIKPDSAVEEVAAPSPEMTVDPEKTPPREANAEKENEVRGSVDDYERADILVLEDNNPEYETEEYGVDYEEEEEEEEGEEEEEESEQEDIQDGDVVEEDYEEENDEEDEGEMASDDVNEHEENDGEEDGAHTEECMVDDVTAAEKEEHHKVFKERRNRKEFEVFVGGLDKNSTEDDLRGVFSKVGEVTEIRLMMNRKTKKNKGFAFLRFATTDQAKQACTELKNPVVNGKRCGVTPRQDDDTLFLGNICKTWTKDALKDKLKHYGVDNFDDLSLVEDSNNPGVNRGFAFLEFSSRSDIKNAFKLLQKKDLSFGSDRPAKVSFADTFIGPDDVIMAQVCTVFVNGLLASWDEDYVRGLLKHYGQVEKVELARNMPSARRKDYGFVTFDSHDAAVNCAKSINNEDLGEGDNKAKVRARLSRPQQSGQKKHASHGNLRSGSASRHSVRVPRTVPIRGARAAGMRAPPVKRPASFRDRRPVVARPPRSRAVSPRLPRSFNRRAPSVPKYPKRRDHGRREALPPRNRPVANYSPRVASARSTSYRDDYNYHGSDYADLARVPSQPAERRGYIDDGYARRYERLPSTYLEGRVREYDSMAGSKRPHSAMDDVHQRYVETEVRYSRPTMDYELGSSSSNYVDAYDRLGRSRLEYRASRSSISEQDDRGLYGNRPNMSYSGGSYGSRDGGGMYFSGYGGSYISQGVDDGGSSYPSPYSGRGLCGSGSRSYY